MNPFTLLAILSLLMTIIILSALALDQLLEDSDRRARGRNPFVERVQFSASDNNAEFLDRARRKMKAIMRDAPRNQDGTVRYSTSNLQL